MTTDTLFERESQNENDIVQELVSSPVGLKRSSTVYTSNPYSHRPGHSKRLSLNFPVLVPIQPTATRLSSDDPSQSPSTACNNPLPRSSPYTNRSPRPASPVRTPSESSQEPGQTSEAPDFLTLLATQERKVLELKEELHKAETELNGLKKQWANYEANKKRGELKTKSVKLGPVSPKSHRTKEEEHEERERRREARERRLKGLGVSETEIQSVSGVHKKNGQRIFEGRHTRTLSLLQTNSFSSLVSQPGPESRSSVDSGHSSLPRRATESSTPKPNDRAKSFDIAAGADHHPLTPISSSIGIESLSLGKTYKELANAASKKSMPPGADILVKQGRQVYEGVSQGFWNFFEDIRQATVGEEAIHGTQVPERQVRKVKSRVSRDDMPCERHGRKGSQKSSEGSQKANDTHKSEKDNFWKEFGLETPQPRRQILTDAHIEPMPMNIGQKRDGIKEHESKSSTDSKNPPDLLADLIDVNDEEEGWENWLESPASLRTRHTAALAIRDHDHGGENEEPLEESGVTTGEEGKSLGHEEVDVSWAELTR